MKRFSSEEVAQRAGVSRTTVSFVLNNTPGKHIPEETRRKVLAVAAELNYTPDLHARKVAKTAKRQVGIVIYHSGSVLSDAYVIRLLEGLGPVLNRRRCRLILIPLRKPAALEAFIDSHDLDGLLLTNLRLQDWDLENLKKRRVPLVLIGDIPDATVPQIDIDNRTAARLVVEHLADQGHRRIAMIVHAPLQYNAAAERLEAYRQVLAERGLEEEAVAYADFTEESGYQAMVDLLARSPRPTAVFASNDLVAYGALQAVADAGLEVPHDLSVAAFDDDYPSRFLFPPLTSLHVPANAIGEKAAQMLLDLMEGTAPEHLRTILPTTLSVRESTAPPRDPRD